MLTAKQQKACIVYAIKKDLLPIDVLVAAGEKMGARGALGNIKSEMVNYVRKDLVPVTELVDLFNAVPQAGVDEALAKMRK